MNSDNLNKWLSLGANLGVLVGLIVVVLELQQTQIVMSAESSMQRAQMSRENASMAARNNIAEIETKLAAGQELTPEEERNASEFAGNLLRHYEVMHYQNQIGVLDEEIWDNNANGIRSFVSSPLMTYLYPDWPKSGIALRLRKSFVDFSLEPN
jgi:hypothetical protein